MSEIEDKSAENSAVLSANITGPGGGGVGGGGGDPPPPVGASPFDFPGMGGNPPGGPGNDPTLDLLGTGGGVDGQMTLPGMGGGGGKFASSRFGQLASKMNKGPRLS